MFGSIFAGVVGIFLLAASVCAITFGLALLVAGGPGVWLLCLGALAFVFVRMARWAKQPAAIDLAAHFPPDYVSPGSLVAPSKGFDVAPEPTYNYGWLDHKPAPKVKAARTDPELPKPGQRFL